MILEKCKKSIYLKVNITKAIIACNMIDCPQIRISNMIKEMHKEDFDSIKNYAYINEDLNEIVVE